MLLNSHSFFPRDPSGFALRMTTLCHPERPKGAKDPVWRKDVVVLSRAKDPVWRKVRHTATDIALSCGILRFAQS